MPPGSIPLVGYEQTLPRSPSRGPLVVPDWQEQPCKCLPWQGLLWVGHSGFSGKLVLERTLGVTPHRWQLVSQRWATGELMLVWKACGPTCSVPQLSATMYTNSPKWRDGNLLSGPGRSLSIIQAIPPGQCRVRAWRGGNPLPHFSIFLWICVGQLEQP